MRAPIRRVADPDAPPPAAEGRRPERPACQDEPTVAMSIEETVNVAAHHLQVCAKRIRQLASEGGTPALARQLTALADALLDRQAQLLQGEEGDAPRRARR